MPPRLLPPSRRTYGKLEKFGHDSFGDPEAVSLYGMTPTQWHARGVRMLARTTLEAVRDQPGKRIGEDVERAAATAPPGTAFGVVDPFANISVLGGAGAGLSDEYCGTGVCCKRAGRARRRPRLPLA